MQNQLEYIKSKLKFIDDEILLEGNHSVMMGWERPIMKASADIVCENGGNILNIGFGLGIIDSYIQNKKIKSHTIIECHPDVLKRMRQLGWYEKNNVTIIEGFWQNHIDLISGFDGVYFDTWKEQDMYVFLKKVHNIMNKNGILSFFNPCEITKDYHSISQDFYEIIKEKFFISSKIINLTYNGNLDGIDEYWNKNKDKTSIPICRLK